jgi:histidine triad (HIT) family protein
MNDCIFCKIANGGVEKEFTYEDDEVVVFPDQSPIKPIHLLVTPKKHVKEFIDLNDNDLLIKLKDVVQKMIKEKGLDTQGYRIGVNGGGAQLIDHLHIHIMGPFNRGER